MAAAALALGGCAPWLERPFAGLRPPPLPRPGEVRARDAVTIGPLLFLGLGRRRPAARFEHGRPLRTLVVVPPQTRATVAVDLGDRTAIGLLSGRDARRHRAGPGEAHLALACVAGPAQRTYEIAFVLAGPRCLPISVTSRGRTHTARIGFGVRHCAR